MPAVRPRAWRWRRSTRRTCRPRVATRPATPAGYHRLRRLEASQRVVQLLDDGRQHHAAIHRLGRLSSQAGRTSLDIGRIRGRSQVESHADRDRGAGRADAGAFGEHAGQLPRAAPANRWATSAGPRSPQSPDRFSNGDAGRQRHQFHAAVEDDGTIGEVEAGSWRRAPQMAATAAPCRLLVGDAVSPAAAPTLSRGGRRRPSWTAATRTIARRT